LACTAVTTTVPMWLASVKIGSVIGGSGSSRYGCAGCGIPDSRPAKCCMESSCRKASTPAAKTPVRGSPGLPLGWTRSPGRCRAGVMRCVYPPRMICCRMDLWAGSAEGPAGIFPSSRSSAGGSHPQQARGTSAESRIV